MGKGERVLRIESNRLAEGRDSPVIITVVDICVALAHQGRGARSRICFSLFAPLLLRPESGEPLSLGFLTLALRFRLGCGFGLALLLYLNGGQLLFFSLLSLGPRFRLGRSFRRMVLLRLRGSQPLLFSWLSRIRLHCPWERYWHACRE